MSDGYSTPQEPALVPQPNPSGLGALIANMMRGSLPNTASPDTPAPLGTPSGGLPAGAPTGPYTPSGVGTFFGNVGSGIADLARRYMQAGQPSAWAQGAQSVDEAGFDPKYQTPDTAGVTADEAQRRAEQPDTTGAGGPGRPSPMQAPKATQWPPSPSFPKETTTPTPTPPAAEKAPPRQERYIPTPRNARPNAWGRPDYVMGGATRYPGMVPGPFMPQPGDWPGIINGASNFLGNLGSGVIAPLARGMAMFSNEYWVAQRAQQTHKARMAAANFSLYAKQLAMKQAEENREYSEAFAAYGPRKDKNGKDIPGDEDALREAIGTIAAKYNDDKVPSVLARGGIPAVERLIAERHAHGQDVTKMLTQQFKRGQLAEQEQRRLLNEERLKRERRKAAEDESSLDPYRATPRGGGDSAPTLNRPSRTIAPPPEGTPEGDLEFPTEEKVPKPAEAPETTEREPPDDTEQEPPARREIRQSEDEDEKDEKEARQSPSEEILAKAEGAAAPSGAAPTRVAAAETPTKTDAGPQRAAPPAAEVPEWLKHAREGSQPTGAAAPVTAGPPATVPATVPEPAERRPFALPPSPVLKAAEQHTDPVTGAPDPLDAGRINADARRLANGNMTQNEYNSIPKAARRYVQAQRAWIEEQTEKLIKDPKLHGKEFLDALETINPQYAAALKGWVSGDFPVPASAWKNPVYVERAIAAGQKIDPNFNKATYDIRARTKQSFANGQFARQIVSVVTMDYHAARYVENLEKLQKMNPSMLQRFLGGSEYGQMLKEHGLPGGTTQEMRDLLSELEVDRGVLYTEGARATSGAAPHAGEMQLWNNRLDYSGRHNSIAGAVKATNELRHVAQERLRALGRQYDTVVGLGGDSMSTLLNKYRGGGLTGSDQYFNPGQTDVDMSRYATPEAAAIDHGMRMIQGPSSQPSAPGGVVDYREYFK